MKYKYKHLALALFGSAFLFVAHPAEASTNSDFNARVAPKTTIHQMKDKKLVPVQTVNTTREYRIVRPSGWYYIAMSGGQPIYIKKSQAQVVPAKSLTKARLASTANRPLVHAYMKQTAGHAPYEYDRLTAEQAKQFADRALQGNWYIPAKPQSLLVKNIDTFNWHKDVPAGDSSSFPFQIHYFTVLNQLTQAYNDTGNLAYLQYGERMIKSWTKAHPASNYKRLKWGYHDQGTAIRAFHLMNYWDVYKKTSLHKDPAFTQLLLKTLYEHAEILASPEFYKARHNHGIFQDMALTAIAQSFPEFDQSQKWQALASSRLQTQIAQSISPSGIHLEHSPGYQVYVYHTFARFLQWAEENKFTLPSRIEDIKEIPVQLAYMVKPNLALPIFGDTEGRNRGANIIPNTAEYPELLYAVTGGKEGTPPTQLTKQLGDQYSFMREYWAHPTAKFNHATQIMMTAGYHSNAHKHQDDLSIDVFGLGTDFIIESGRYGYSSRQERKDVFKVEAHNTVHRLGKGLDMSSAMVGKSRIVSVEDKGTTSVAIGESELIGEGGTHRRTLVYDKAKTLVVYDHITSPEPDMFVQRFHLDSKIKFARGSVDKQNVTYQRTTAQTLQLIQLETNEESYMARETSFAAVRDFEWVPREQIVSVEYGSDVRYVTLIRLDGSRTPIKEASLEEGDGVYHVHYELTNGEKHSLEVPK